MPRHSPPFRRHFARSGANSWFANCAWDALGIPAALHQDAISNATCSCCNSEMPLEIKGGRILQTEGLIHIAVPARSWYEDVVFTLFQGCSNLWELFQSLPLKCTAKHSFWEGRIGYPRCGNSHEPEHVFASSRSVENKSPTT
jgi:hypothetical protein